MPVLPFHRYIGPGNPIESGPCVDDDDCIARKHDIKYENARTPLDVRSADVEAIQEFRANWLSGNWHSLIGDIGLSLKYCVETYTGVLYPKLGQFQTCEIVSLFHDALKLHCINKSRPFTRYRNPLQTPEFDYKIYKILNTYDFTKSHSPDEIRFYVLVAWYQFYHKNVQSETNIETAFEPKKLKMPKHNSNYVENCDIFNVKAWIRFFAQFRVKAQPADDYNEEEFTNMFLLYD